VVYVLVVEPADWPHCPACRAPAMVRVTSTQAMCGVEDCEVLIWDTEMTDPMADARRVVLYDQEQPDGSRTVHVRVDDD
jgi:hypothetical protein